MSKDVPITETPRTNQEKIEALVEQEIAAELTMLSALEAKSDIDVMLNDFVFTHIDDETGKEVLGRSEYLLKKLVDIANVNGGLKELGQMWFEFYQKQEYKNLYVVWLLATKPKYREPILKVLSPLIVAEKMMAALAQKQEEAKKKK